MKVKLFLASLICAGTTLLCLAAHAGSADTRTVKGWFADEACTRERVAAGRIEPNNPECAKRCIKEGSKLVFISETDKGMFYVTNPDNAANAIGYYVEVSGTTDAKAKSLTVDSIKKLSEVNASCERRKSKKQ